MNSQPNPASTARSSLDEPESFELSVNPALYVFPPAVMAFAVSRDRIASAIVSGFAPFAFTIDVKEAQATSVRELVDSLPLGDYTRIAFVVGLLDSSPEARRVAGILEGCLATPVTYVERNAWRKALTRLPNPTKGDADEFVKMVPCVAEEVSSAIGRDAVALALARVRDESLASSVDSLGQGSAFFAEDSYVEELIEVSFPLRVDSYE